MKPTSDLAQGILGCWIDIIPATEKKKLEKKWPCDPAPPRPFEFRCVIWET